MASLMMHLAISNKLKEIYNYSDDFLVGAIAPDLLKKVYTRDVTHYIKQIQLEGEIRRYPDIDKFLNENKEKNDEYFFGYLAHLVQDKIWFNEYMPKVIKRLTREKCMYIKNNVIVSEREATLDLYNEYAIAGEYIAKKYDKVDSIGQRKERSYGSGWKQRRRWDPGYLRPHYELADVSVFSSIL